MSSRVTRALAAVIATGITVLASLVAVAPPATSTAATYAGQDGRIAFVRDNQVFSMNRWGGDVKRLTSQGSNSHPKWSPDGSRISFIHEAGGRRDVWVMASGGARKRAVTNSGDVVSAGATWSPDGLRLAYSDGELKTIGSRAPYGTPQTVLAYQTGGFCEGDPSDLQPVWAKEWVAWSPDGTRIAVRSDSDCQLDYRVDHVHLATGEQQMVLGSGADCCGYVDYTDLFFGAGQQFGWTERDRGPYGEDVDAPTYIVFGSFESRAGDSGGAPSPSGTYLALTNSGMVVRATADGSRRKVLARGTQADWQVRPS